jgi:protein TonB
MKNKILLVLFFVCISICGIAQTTPAPSDSLTATVAKDDEVLVFAEQMPEYPGGKEAFNKYLMTTVRYPQAEKETMKQGTVYVQFTVEKDGSITDVHTTKEVPEAPGLSAEAIRVMSNMPGWTPGKVNGKPVRVQVTQPIRFVLDTKGSKKKKH